MFRLRVKVRKRRQCAAPKVEAAIAKFHHMAHRFIDRGVGVRFFDFDKQVWAVTRDGFPGAFKQAEFKPFHVDLDKTDVSQAAVIQPCLFHG